jgi:PTS system nitrogen regulatory IIA component
MTNLSKILSLENVQLDLEVSSKKRAFEQAGLIFENNCGIARSTWAMAWPFRTGASRAARA